jgi:hypothetical protein
MSTNLLSLQWHLCFCGLLWPPVALLEQLTRVLVVCCLFWLIACVASADHTGAAWAVFLVLTWVHVWANIRALRCLVLVSLNESRLQLLIQHYLTKVSHALTQGEWRAVGCKPGS